MTGNIAQVLYSILEYFIALQITIRYDVTVSRSKYMSSMVLIMVMAIRLYVCLQIPVNVMPKAKAFQVTDWAVKST